MTRALGLDHGDARIGVAISDELGMLAHPLTTIHVKAGDPIEAIAQIVQRDQIANIVLGMPRNMDGSYGPAAERVQEFVTELKKVLPLRIKKWDERLTTSQANRVLLQGDVGRQKRKQVIDKMAAAILLQGYLDALSSKEN